MSISVGDNSLNKTAKKIWLGDNGTYKEAKRIWVGDNGTWKLAYTSVTPILWNKLGSDTEVQNSEIGTNFTVTGTPTYSDAKFNNGTITTTNNYISFSGWQSAFPNKNEFTIEFWIKFNAWSIVNGRPSNSLPNWVFMTLDTSGGREYGYIHLSLRGDAAYSPMFIVYDGQVANGGSNLEAIAAMPTSVQIPLNSLAHFGLTYTFAGGVGTVKMYIDNVLIATGTATHVDGLNFNTNSNGVFTTQYASRTLNGNTIDNIKIWDFAKTDFSDRNTEGI